MSLFGTGRREGLLAVLTLLLLSIVVHGRGLFLDQPRQQPPSKSFAEHGRESYTNEDTLVPAMADAAAVVERGEVPLWNPHARFGEPFEFSGAPVIYLPYWLLWLGGLGSVELLLCLHTFLACMSMYRFCRITSISRYVAAVCGALYGLGWNMQAQLDRLPHAAVLAILPLALEATWRILISPRRHTYAAWLAVVLTMMFATGGHTTAVFGGILCVAVFCFHLYAMDRENRIAAIGAAGVSCVIAGLLTAPLWLHALSHQGANAVQTASHLHHLQLGGLVSGFGPGLFGGLSGTAPEALNLVNPGADALELVLFPGSCALFIAVLGILRPKRTSRALLWLGVLGLGLLLSMDSPIVEYMAHSRWLPDISPGIGLGFAHLAFAVLTSISLESFFEAPMARRFSVPVASGVTLAVAAGAFLVMFVVPSMARSMLSGWLELDSRDEVQAVLRHMRTALLPTILFAGVIAGLFLAWRKMGLLRFKAVLQILIVADLLMVAILHVPRGEGKTGDTGLATRIPADKGRGILAGRPLTEDAAPLRRSGIATVTATTPRILARTADYLRVLDPSMVQVGTRARVLPLQTTPKLTSPLLDIAGVGVVIAQGDAARHGFTPLSPAPEGEVKPGTAGGVFLRSDSSKRARMMFEVIPATSPADAAEKLATHEADLLGKVILEGDLAGFTCKPPSGEPVVEFVHDGANRVVLTVDTAGGSGYLLLADAYAPGWVARVDGKPATLHPADLAMRAVAVPEGKHRITFSYHPLGWRLGAPLALLGLLVLVVWVIGVRVREWRAARARALVTG